MKAVGAQMMPLGILNAGHGAAGFVVCLAGSQPQFNSILSCHVPSPPLQNGGISSMSCVLEYVRWESGVDSCPLIAHTAFI